MNTFVAIVKPASYIFRAPGFCFSTFSSRTPGSSVPRLHEQPGIPFPSSCYPSTWDLLLWLLAVRLRRPLLPFCPQRYCVPLTRISPARLRNKMTGNPWLSMQSNFEGRAHSSWIQTPRLRARQQQSNAYRRPSSAPRAFSRGCPGKPSIPETLPGHIGDAQGRKKCQLPLRPVARPPESGIG